MRFLRREIGLRDWVGLGRDIVSKYIQAEMRIAYHQEKRKDIDQNVDLRWLRLKCSHLRG